MGFPILVKSVRHWFKREFPAVPVDCVHFACGAFSQEDLNPYDSRVIVSYEKHDYLDKVLGFVEYGQSTVCDTFTAFSFPPPPQVVRATFSATFDEIRMYINTPYPPPNPVIDLLILTVGRYDWHYVETIPVECLQHIGLSLPPECTEHHTTLQDYQTFYRLGLKEKPRTWYTVPLSRVPNDLAKHLVLYKGGVVHLPASYVWQAVIRPVDSRRRPTEQLELVKIFCEERASRGSRKRRRKHVKVIDSRKEFDALAPPCIQRILEKKRFPADQERQQLVRTWAKAGVELKLVGDILDEQNERYPHADGHVKTQRRWDYVAHYNRGYAPPSCEKMECPLAPGQPIDVKKAECFKLFTEKFPNKTAYTKGFYGPIKWYEW